jgi:hypothetical protein
MKPTSELYDVAYKAYDRGERHTDGVENVVQAVLDHLFPEPGTNPLAQCAPDRDTTTLRRLRNVLLQADHSEMAIRGAKGARRIALVEADDPEQDEILTAVSNVRRALEPWRMAGTESLNGS